MQGLQLRPQSHQGVKHQSPQACYEAPRKAVHRGKSPKEGSDFKSAEGHQFLREQPPVHHANSIRKKAIDKKVTNMIVSDILQT